MTWKACPPNASSASNPWTVRDEDGTLLAIIPKDHNLPGVSEQTAKTIAGLKNANDRLKTHCSQLDELISHLVRAYDTKDARMQDRWMMRLFEYYESEILPEDT